MKSYEQEIVRIISGKPATDADLEMVIQTNDEEQVEEAAGEAHPMALHVKPVEKDGKPMYQVHAVGKKLAGGIKVGEHLSDTELDDATEMGAKIKHIKEEEQIDEISKSTLGSYVKKASLDMANKSAEVEKDLAAAKSDYSMMRRKGVKKPIAQNMMKRDVDTALSRVGKASKRMGGIERATDRLTKEEVEEVNEQVDITVIEHNAFVIDLPENLSFADYIKAAKAFVENEQDAIAVADKFFRENDESIVVESVTKSDIEDRADNWRKAGHKVSLPKYTTKDGKLHAEYTVTDKDTGQKTKYVYHGSRRSVEKS